MRECELECQFDILFIIEEDISEQIIPGMFSSGTPSVPPASACALG